MNTKHWFLKKNYTMALALATISALLVFSVALATTAGDLDTTFGNRGIVTTKFGSSHDVAIQADGKIIAVGDSIGNAGSTDFALVRFNNNGSPDTTFGKGGIVTTDFGATDTGFAIVIQPNGKIVATGARSDLTGSGNIDLALARYNSSGSLDATFGKGGKVTTDFGAADYGDSVVIGPDGKIIVGAFSYVGNLNSIALARYNSNGSLDTTFNGDGKVTTALDGTIISATLVAVQPDNKIVVSGANYAGGGAFVLERYNTDGSLDATFGTGGIVTTVFGGITFNAGIAIQPDGKIILAGDTHANGTQDFALTRYNTDGSPDMTFDGDGKVITDFNGASEGLSGVALQKNGQIIVSGHRSNPSDADFALARYNSDGSLDQTFGGDENGDPPGLVTTKISDGNDLSFGVAIQPDGKIVLTGAGGTGSLGFLLVRYAGEDTVQYASIGADDGWVLESAQGSGRGGVRNATANTIRIGDDISNRQYRAILSFDTSSLPDNATVTSAALKIAAAGFVGVNPFNTLGKLGLDIRNGPFGGNAALQVTDFNAPATATNVGYFKNVPAGLWYSAALNPVGRKNINKIGLTQLRLRFAVSTNRNRIANYLQFRSGNVSGAYQPELVITYTVP